MPLYEYQCQQCGQRLEKIQKFSDAPLTTCPHCGGTLEKLLTAPAVQFAGGGWYKDLYSSTKPAAGSSASGSSSSASGSSSTPAASPAPAAPASTSSTGGSSSSS